MTRLKEADIADIQAQLDSYDARLKAAAGVSLWGIGCRTAGIPADRARKVLGNLDVAVVPLTGGLGVIGGFAESVAGIVSHAGGRGFVTENPDAAGVAEAYEQKAHILMLADDFRFVAIHLESRRVADNGVLTGEAYAVGLDVISGGVAGRPVLVLGCGPVGGSAAERLARMGARVSLYDICPEPALALKARLEKATGVEIFMADSMAAALEGHELMIEATPVGGTIGAEHVTDRTFVGAPGMPCGLTEAARAGIGDRLLHDPLEIGVTAMLAVAVKYHMEQEA